MQSELQLQQIKKVSCILSQQAGVQSIHLTQHSVHILHPSIARLICKWVKYCREGPPDPWGWAVNLINLNKPWHPKIFRWCHPSLLFVHPHKKKMMFCHTTFVVYDIVEIVINIFWIWIRFTILIKLWFFLMQLNQMPPLETWRWGFRLKSKFNGDDKSN